MKNYEPGEKIRSLDELIDSEFVFFHNKLYHNGWFMSWPIRSCMNLMDRGVLRIAVRKASRKETGALDG
jgi:hypothetical protein